MYPLLTTDPAVSANAVEKNCHGSSAVNVNTAYGTPSDGSFAIRPKTTVKMTIVKNGRMNAHKTPIEVCLYRTTMSRQARYPSSSRYSQTSARSSCASPRRGLMTVCKGREFNAEGPFPDRKRRNARVTRGAPDDKTS